MKKYKGSELIYEKDKPCTKITIVLEGSLVDEAGNELVGKG